MQTIPQATEGDSEVVMGSQKTVAQHLDLTTGLIRSAALIQDICAIASSEHGLTPQQAQLMGVVGDKPSKMVWLGELLRIGKSSMTGLVHRAERAGIVRRVPDPGDGRSTLIMLTDEGRRTNTAFRATVGERIERIIATLPTAERNGLATALSMIVLNNHAPETWPTEQEYR